MLMKRRYEKPMLCIEHYALTQTIAACSGIKIKDGPGTGYEDVLNDPDATNTMKTMARRGGFLTTSDGCRISLVGTTDTDGVCYHTNINAAFNS